MTIQISRTTGFALCLSQAAVTVGVVMFFPQVQVQTISCHPLIINGTIAPASPTLTTATIPLSLPFIILSFVAILFSTSTAGLLERGLFSSDSVYSFEILYEAGLWDLLFWAYCLGAHTLAILIAMSPADIYAVSISIILVVYFLARICQPRSSQSLSMTQENLNLLGICAGLLIIGYNFPDSHSGRAAAILIMCVLDYLLGVGHTWDIAPTMEIITNCRLFWVCSVSFCMAGLYGAWKDHLLVEQG
jgi:hypothetical protein